jgi:hypothetical protein
MKNINTVIICALLFIACQRASLQESIQEYKKAGIALNIPNTMVPIKLVNQEDTHYDLAYQFKNNDKYELRIGLYPIDFLNGIDKETDNDKVKQVLWGISCATGYNIAGTDKQQTRISFFPVPAVTNEFGADLGTTNTVSGNSNFAGKYKIVMINSFYKKEKNYVVVYHLIENIDEYKNLLKQKEFVQAFHCIRFE